MIINNTKIEGISIAGDQTNIRLPELKIQFDIGKCPKKAVYIPNLLLTHGHPDHAGGIVNYLFERKLQNLKPPKIFAPQSLINPLKSVSNIFSSLHNSKYPADFIGVTPGSRIFIEKGVYLEAMQANHGMDSYCYAIFKDEISLNPDIVFTGDTSIDILDKFPGLYHAKILIIESTFLRDEALLEKAQIHQHIHLNQIFERADLFNNDFIVLVHQSARFTPFVVKNEVSKNSPEVLKDKIRFLFE